MTPLGSSRAYLLPVLLAVTAGVYASSAGNGYVWDDVPLVVDNRILAGPLDLATVFTTDLWAGAPIGDDEASGYYRPLMLLSLWADRALGLGAAGAHLHSLLWHLLAVWGAHAVGRHLGPAAAVAGAVVLALHPAQSEAVLWVAARNDLMAAALGLWALEGVVSKRSGLWVLGFTLLAGLSKESVLLLPLLGGSLLWARGELAQWRRLLPMGGAIVAVVLLRAWAGVDGAGVPPAAGWSLMGRQVGVLVGAVGRQVVLPWPLSTGHALEYLHREGVLAHSVGGVALAALLGVGLARGGRVGRLGLAWALLAALPAVWAVADKGWWGERYLYLSMVGVGWVLASVVPSRSLRVGLPVLASVWALLVWARVPHWTSDHTLWTSAHAATPSPFTHESLGHAEMGRENWTGARDHFIAALDDPEPLSTACAPLMRAVDRVPRRALNAQLSHWAASVGCSDPEFMGRRALLLAVTQDFGRLDAILAEASPEPSGHLALARALRLRTLGHTAEYDAVVAERSDPAQFVEQIEHLLPAVTDPTLRPDRSPP